MIDLKAGDVLRASWGYDQTNVEYFVAEKVTGSMVTLAPIKGQTTETGFMCGTSVPKLPIEKTGEKVLRRKYANGCAKIYSFGGYARKIVPDADGNYSPSYVSWYA